VKHPNQDFLDTSKYSQWGQQIKDIIQGKQLTYKYILLTAALAKAVNPNVHYRALQQGSKLQGAYDARSIAHRVVVPFEKSHGERFGGSNEPFLNRPRLSKFFCTRQDIGERVFTADLERNVLPLAYQKRISATTC
jgi:hypothetical protein